MRNKLSVHRNDNKHNCFHVYKRRYGRLRLVIRLLLVPVIAGISYEFIMFAGKSDSKLANALSVPGMWVQRLTTREPDLDMIAVAIKSVEAVIDWEAYQDAMHKGEIED